MKSKSRTKLKQPAFTPRSTYKTKTKDDFMRWWQKQNAHKKQVAEEKVIQEARATSQALMVWADDGGAVD